jgi:predicted Abi (CAAX) family protease
LTNYSLNYKLGEYPSVDIKGVIFNWTASEISFSPKPVNLNTFNVGDPCFIDTNIAIASSNRFQSFGINIDVNRIPNYTIGNYLPDAVYIQYPIKQEVNLDLSASTNLYYSNTLNLPNSGYITPSVQYISIKKYQSNSNLATFNFVYVNNNFNSSLSSDSEAKFVNNRVSYIQP